MKGVSSELEKGELCREAEVEVKLVLGVDQGAAGSLRRRKQGVAEERIEFRTKMPHVSEQCRQHNNNDKQAQDPFTIRIHLYTPCLLQYIRQRSQFLRS